ncbi:MAG: glycosyltransferase family 39 protein [Anaerolineae bacterium]
MSHVQAPAQLATPEPGSGAAGLPTERPTSGDRDRLLGRGDLIAVLSVTLLAAIVRFWALDRFPPGMHYDEGYNALDALRILEGVRPIFFTGNFGREPLFNYVIALAFGLFTPGPVVMRALAAMAGTLAVPLTYGIGRLLAPRYRAPAVLAALVQATLPWDLHFSRYGLRIELLPLLGSAAVLCLLVGWRRQRWPWFIASGAFLGLSLYGYMASRLLPLVLLPWGLLVLWRTDRTDRRRLLLAFALVAATAAIVFTPLGAYFVGHPDSFTQRVGQVALRGSVGDVLEQLAGNTWLWLKAMVVAGDSNPRNNLPGAPALTPWLWLPWALGLLYCLRRLRHPEWALAPLWFAVMLLPSILSDYAPSFQRAIGAVPPLCLTVGIGLWQLREGVATLTRRRAAGLALAAILVLGSGVQGLHQYFVQWGRSNALYYAFDEGLYEVGEYIRDRAAVGARVYISPVRADHTTLQFLMRDGGDPVTFDGRKVFVLPPVWESEVEYIILTQEDPVGLEQVVHWFPGMEVVRTFADRLGQTYAVALRSDIATAAPVTPRLKVGARWEGGISLIGLEIWPNREAANSLQVRLYWQASEPQNADYTSFVHVVGPLNEATGSPLWAGADAMPGDGSYTTCRWSPGETVVESRNLALPQLDDGEYYLEVGWYLLATGERLDLYQPYARNSLLIGPYLIEEGRVVSWPDPVSPVSVEGPR